MKRKSSKQRDMILSYLRSIDEHVTAEEVYKNMKNAGLDVSLATVYRNLHILSEMHEIRRIAHPIDGYLYDKTCKPHHHLYCVCCKRLLDLALPYEEAWNRKIEARSGCQVFSHSITVEGVCKDCQKAEASQRMVVK